MKEKADPKPARVALVITELDVGGAERCLTNLALGLDRQRFSPLVISLAPRPPARRDLLVRRLEQAAVPVHFLDLRSWRQFSSALKQLRGLFDEQAPDVAQMFLFHANVLGAVAARKADIPVLTGIRVADPRRHRLWIERRATSGAFRTVCVSRAVADFMIRRGGFPEERIAVIPNGIDTAPYLTAAPLEKAELGVPEIRRILVAIGRLDKQKGLDWLLSLCPQLFAAAPDHDLVLVGDGPQRQKLEAAAQNAGVSERVHFTGWREDVPRILAASDMLLLPSRWEGMPNVVLEAMAAGLPVVATRSEGVLELLQETAGSQTASFGDDCEFARRVSEITANAHLASQLGQENRRRVAHHFSLESMIAAYERLYIAAL
ncbi:MAG: glycosyltransferase [Planctomycetes bacterium]|nr:glycosyltransferase [Planctomycetota bacterium]